MGVVPGAVLEILRQNGRGPVLIALGESRLALGRGIAEKILVEPAHP
jgi:Fe2+ transport system protein FeoA